MIWARVGSGSRYSLTRVVPAAVLILVGLFIMGAGTYVTLMEMINGDAPAAPPPPPAAPPPGPGLLLL
jgi:hypothetical protein